MFTNNTSKSQDYCSSHRFIFATNNQIMCDLIPWEYDVYDVYDFMTSAGCRLSRLLVHKLLFPCDLESHHAVFECLDLALARTPVLVLGHALLHRIVQISTASAGNHPFQRVVVVVVIGFTRAVVGWRGCHSVTYVQTGWSVEDMSASVSRCEQREDNL